MNDVVYAIEIHRLESSGLSIMDVKIGITTTNIDDILRQYSRSSRDVELLDMWKPNPQKNLHTVERGVHDIAEKYAYDRESEKFLFLQGNYENFKSSISKILQHTTKQELSKDSESIAKEVRRDFTGTTPGAIKILGETHSVQDWTDTLVTAMTKILNDVENQEKVTEIKGSKRSYFVQESEQFNLISPKKIPNTALYIESNFSANAIVRIIRRVMRKYEYNVNEFEILFAESGDVSK